MTGHLWLDVILGVAAALLLSWLILIVTLAIRRPKGNLEAVEHRSCNAGRSSYPHRLTAGLFGYADRFDP
jgi:hypothetical protein